jgi:molecular chaperone DnaK (HSP70)
MTFGIDLGTTHSCIAYIDETGRPAVIRSALGEDTTPSVVYFEAPQSVMVGRAAKDAARLEPEKVAQLVKRDMGTEAEYTYLGERHTPETISALILRELARAAAENTGKPVRDVVITVPAYVGVAEREATRRAGQIAGLNVLDVLTEPVAAAVHYQAMTSAANPGTRNILVYDLGGGTFDTTVIRMDGDDIAVVCTDGDHRLGGADWDEVLVGYLLDQFQTEHPGLEPRSNPAFLQDLFISAEQLKKDLSVTQARRYIMRFGGAVTRVELTRAKLEELTAPLLDRTIEVTRRILDKARSQGLDHYDDVLLVGGMTKMPAVTRALKERLDLAARLYEPDLAAAKGAAQFALLRTARPDGAAGPDRAEQVATQTGLTVPEVEQLASKRVSTVISRGFGTRSIDGSDPLALSDPARARQIVIHLLPANTPLPADTGPYTFATAMDNQRMVMVEVWEQAGTVASTELADNRKIGQGLLSNLPAKLPAMSPIEVTFFMSETGKLSVHAREPGSGQDLNFDLQIGGLDQAGMEKARTAIGRYQVSG